MAKLSGTPQKKRRTLIGLLIFCALFQAVFFSRVSAQPAGSDTAWATDIVSRTDPKTDADRARVISEIVVKLREQSGGNPELASAANILEYQLELIKLNPRSLSDYVEWLKDPRLTAATRGEVLRHARVDLLDRTFLLILSLDKTKITAADAQRISEFVKYTSQALDEFFDPALIGGRTSDFTRLASRLNGVAKLTESVTDPSARRILGGLRGTLGTIERRIKDMNVTMPSPMRAFEIPAEVAAAIVDNSRQGMNESAAALDEIAKAISGDSGALERFEQHAKNVERTLSPRSYGQQMIDAFAKRTADRIPFIRTLAYWFQPGEGLTWLVGKWKVSTGNPPDVMIVEFKREATGVFGYIVALSRFGADRGYKSGQMVYRGWIEAPEDDPLRQTFKHVARGECLYTRPDTKEQFWSRTRFEIGTSITFVHNQIGVTENNCA
ncbi:MAG TPA: hypothetical protein VJL58_07905, partial [Pyrinomonadaceae bacterium]|nr:hypothetical protein [Pyrinomonadaceae bacterium]